MRLALISFPLLDASVSSPASFFALFTASLVFSFPLLFPPSPPSLHASFSFSAWETSLLPSVITQYTLTDGTPLEQV